MTSSQALIVRDLGIQDYKAVWKKMTDYTDRRRKESLDDQLWLVEHPPTYTQGQAVKAEHILNPGNIPVVQSDRGGQVTYHGPGQLVVYPLLDLRRLGLGVRDLVTHLEAVLIAVLDKYQISSYAKPNAPGVYVGEAKIASLGLRVRRSCSFHGLSLNVDMDLSPFESINPCGYAGMSMTDMSRLTGSSASMEKVKASLVEVFVRELAYKDCIMRS